MISKETYETMREKYGKVSSWAIWAPERDTPKSNIGNLSVFQNLDLDELNPNYVFVGLNVSGNGEIWKDLPDWVNFHSSNPRHHDYKLRYALKNTPYWGAYITDIIKNHSCTDSSKVMSYLKAQPDILKENIESFEEEIAYLGVSPVLVAMGDKVYRILNENLGDRYTIRKIKHYSFTISKEDYREEVLEELGRG